MSQAADYLAWLDEETTGLEDDDHTVEVAVILTDPQLNIIDRFTTLVRPTPETFAKLEANAFVRAMHERSGLLQELIDGGDNLPTIEDVETALIAFLERNVPDGSTVMMAGGGVAHFDLHHLRKRTSKFIAKLHYGTVDVSDVVRGYVTATGNKDTFRKTPDKKHRALDDIEDDLRVAATVWDMFQMYDARHLSGEHAATDTDRVLAGASLLHAAASAEASNAMASILDELSSRDVIAGVTAVGAELLKELSAATGKSITETIEGVRLRALA